MAAPRKPATFTGSSPLAPLMAQFVQEKRACGYRYNVGAWSLRRLDAHLCRQGLQQVELPRSMTSSWLTKQPHETGKTQRARINLVRQFALFMRRLGLPADVPDQGSGAKESKSFLARVLTHEEVRRLLDTVDRIEPMASTHLRHIVLPELLRVLYGCGLRLEEALSLRIRDVDLIQGVLHINDTKFRKDRLVPPARPLVVRLQKYAAALGPRSDDDYFFPSPRGGQLHGSGVYRNYRDLLHRCHIGHGGRGEGPRLHDLRHNSGSRIIPGAASRSAAPSSVVIGGTPSDPRHYQRPLRKSSRRSLGRKRGTDVFLAVVAARARSFSCMSACR
jgi:integrase